jgi:hypothetical protein
MIILILFGVFLFFTIFTSFVSILTYGKPIDDDLVLEWVEKCNANHGFKVNPYDESIISGSFKDPYWQDIFFTQPPLPILFKYYINGIGVVWRWSKGAQALDQIRNDLSVGSSKDFQRRKLGL